MSLLKIVYSRPQFLEFQGKRSINNRRGASNAFNWFDKYLSSLGETEASVLPKLKEIKGQEEFYLFLNNFVQYMNQSLHAHSVQTYLSFMKGYLRKHGFRIYSEDMMQFVDFPDAPKETKVPLEKKQLSKLYLNSNPYLKMAISWLTSSGMRVSEFLQLEKTDVKFNTDPVEIHIRTEISKTGAERTTFLSQQAIDSINKSYLFREYKPLISIVNIELQFAHLRKRLGFTSRYRTSRNHHITIHTIRSFTRTQAGKISPDFAETIIGHDSEVAKQESKNVGNRKEYIRPPLDDLKTYYKQLEPLVTL